MDKNSISSFSETLKRLRKEHNLSQQQLADMLFVERSAVANWETSRRMPDVFLLERIAKCLNTDIYTFLNQASTDTGSTLNVIIVDDESILLQGTIPVLEQAMPTASVKGFTSVNNAIEYVRSNNVCIAFLDIELGTKNGFNLCSTLTDINPTINVIFLTSYPDYAIKAWDTPACGFLLKPLSAEDVKKQLSNLRHPVKL